MQQILNKNKTLLNVIQILTKNDTFIININELLSLPNLKRHLTLKQYFISIFLVLTNFLFLRKHLLELRLFQNHTLSTSKLIFV